MPRNYPLLTVSLPKGSDPKQVRADFAEVAKRHGLLTDYHSRTEHGSPGLLIQAINSGDVVTCLFDEYDYVRALAALQPFAAAREMWAESLVAAIQEAQKRRIEADSDLDDYEPDYEFEEVE